MYDLSTGITDVLQGISHTTCLVAVVVGTLLHDDRCRLTSKQDGEMVVHDKQQVWSCIVVVAIRRLVYFILGYWKKVMKSSI
jgi:hypothetical protein